MAIMEAGKYLVLFIILGILAALLFMYAQFDNHRLHISEFDSGEDLVLMCEELCINTEYVNTDNCKPFFKLNANEEYSYGVQICLSEQGAENLFAEGSLTVFDENYTYRLSESEKVKGRLYRYESDGANANAFEYEMNGMFCYIIERSYIESEYLREKYFA